MQVSGILQEKLDLVMKNGDHANCYPGCINLTSFCAEGESFMMALCPGSACTYASLQPSYVLKALSAQDDMEEVVLYTLEKTVQEVGMSPEVCRCLEAALCSDCSERDSPA